MKPLALPLAWLALLAIHAAVTTGNPTLANGLVLLANPTICLYVNDIYYRIGRDNQLIPVDTTKPDPCDMFIPDASSYTEGQMEAKKGHSRRRMTSNSHKKQEQMDRDLHFVRKMLRQTENKLLRRRRRMVSSSYEECTTKDGKTKKRFDPKGMEYLYRILEDNQWTKKRCEGFKTDEGFKTGEFDPHSCNCVSLKNPKPLPLPKAQKSDIDSDTKTNDKANSAGCLMMTWQVCCFLCMAMMAIF